jgi:VWFA-related protein
MPGPHVKDRRRFLSHLLTASSAIAAPWALPGLAQTVLPPESNPAKDLVFSTSVRVVNILATVRDRDGKIVRNLTKDDFTLEEAGHPQEIRYFSQQTDLPITVGLLVDLSSSVAFLVEKEKMASQAFLRNVMREQDLGFVMSFGFRVYINQEPTSSRSDLARVIGSLQPRYGGTRLYDAVTVASNELLSLRDGRKTIVVMTDG